MHCVPLCSEIQFQAHVHIMCPITDFFWVKSGVGQEFRDTYFGKVEKAFIPFLLKQLKC